MLKTCKALVAFQGHGQKPLISFEGTLVSVRGLDKIVAGPLKGFAHNIKGL